MSPRRTVTCFSTSANVTLVFLQQLFTSAASVVWLAYGNNKTHWRFEQPKTYETVSYLNKDKYDL